jgi:hypothetical protein
LTEPTASRCSVQRLPDLNRRSSAIGRLSCQLHMTHAFLLAKTIVQFTEKLCDCCLASKGKYCSVASRVRSIFGDNTYAAGIETCKVPFARLGNTSAWVQNAKSGLRKRERTGLTRPKMDDRSTRERLGPQQQLQESHRGGPSCGQQRTVGLDSEHQKRGAGLGTVHPP